VRGLGRSRDRGIEPRVVRRRSGLRHAPAAIGCRRRPRTVRPRRAGVRRRSRRNPWRDGSRTLGAARRCASGSVGGRASRRVDRPSLLGRYGIEGRLWYDRRRALGEAGGGRRRLDSRRIDRRRRLGCRHGLRRRLGSRGARRQERERVQVSLRVGRRADADVHVRRGKLRIPRGADRAHDCAFGDLRSARHVDRPEVEQRHRHCRRRLDRDRPAAAGNRPGERHDALGRCGDGRLDCRGDVDAAMLAARVWMGAVEVEATHDLAVHRPGPRARRCGRKREGAEDQDAESSHVRSSFVVRTANEAKDSERPAPLSILATRYDGRARSGRHP
jgi:hypothetical protein